MPDVLFILLLTLVIFGPKKLPEMARQFGKYVAHLKRLKSEFANQIEFEMLKSEGEKEAETTANRRV